MPAPSRNDRELRQRAALMHSMASAGRRIGRTRAALALAAVLVGAVVAAFLVPTVVHQRQEADDLDVATAIEVEEARQDAVQELTRAQERAHAQIDEADAFLASGLDYADPTDVSDLRSALDTLEDVVGSNDADAIAAARRGVESLISSIGDSSGIS